MRTQSIAVLLVGLLCLSACSVRRYIPKNEKIFRSYNIEIEKSPEVKTRKKALLSEIKIAVQPKPNKFFLGQPWKVWWWYAIGTPKKERGFTAFIRKRLGEPPVFSSRINTVNTATSIESRLENLGYFKSTASGDTSSNSYFIKAHYKVKVKPRYYIDSITWVNDSSALLKQLIRAQGRGNSLIKSGDPYNLDNISAERQRLDLSLKNRGYYYFNPNYLMAYVDSTIGNRKVHLYLNIKNTTPDYVRYPYKINKINIYPNFSLTSEILDSSGKGLIVYDTLNILDTQIIFKPKLFAQSITYRPGRTYSSRAQNATLSRLINLNVFKFVKNRFEIADTIARKLDVNYYLTPAKKRSLQGSIEAFSKENSYIGAQVGMIWRNRNAFKGAELVSIKTSLGAELAFADSVKNNNYRLSGEITLKVPRYAVPLLKGNENLLYPPVTNMVLGYELLRKQLFYTKNLTHARYEVSWRKSRSKSFTLSPISLSALYATNISDTFYRQAEVNPALLLNVYSEAILGSYLSFTYSPSRPRDKNTWIFNSSIDLSGNLAGLITGAKTFRQKAIFKTPFAQYIKADAEFLFFRHLDKTMDWANRFQLGLGFPYNNSAMLPITKQYVIGGSSLLRGFAMRSVGPGTYKPTAEDQKLFQIIGGDFKLLLNSELRFQIIGRLKGAAFADVGNIWTKDTIMFGKAAQINKYWFKELAVTSGFGLRFDATVILIRVDLGIPLRKPYLPEGERWVIKDIQPGSAKWRRDNLVLNIALGYPF